MNITKVDIVVLNYNGMKILPQCLPSIVEAAKASPVPCSVIVLDNQSTDNSVDYIKNTFPSVIIKIAKSNRILFSYNDLIPQLKSEVIILLNNDIKVDAHFIAPLLEHYKADNVFGVAPKSLEFDGNGYNGGKNKIVFSHGLIEAGQQFYGKEDMEREGYTYYCANSSFDCRKFLELGGFDDIYYPSTWEDTDLCYKALKKGYVMIYEPASVIYHNEHFIISNEVQKKNPIFRRRSVNIRRNSFLFTWINITDPSLLRQHFLWLPFNLLVFLLYQRTKLLGFFDALKYIPRIRERRRRFKPVISDAALLSGYDTGPFKGDV